MITVFNRKELCVTLSLQRQMEVRRCLTDGGVAYVLKTKNLTAGGQFGHLGLHPEMSLEYRIYVHREDEARARQLLKDETEGEC